MGWSRSTSSWIFFLPVRGGNVFLMRFTRSSIQELMLLYVLPACARETRFFTCFMISNFQELVLLNILLAYAGKRVFDPFLRSNVQELVLMNALPAYAGWTQF